MTVKATPAAANRTNITVTDSWIVTNSSSGIPSTGIPPVVYMREGGWEGEREGGREEGREGGRGGREGEREH